MELKNIRAMTEKQNIGFAIILLSAVVEFFVGFAFRLSAIMPNITSNGEIISHVIASGVPVPEDSLPSYYFLCLGVHFSA